MMKLMDRKNPRPMPEIIMSEMCGLLRQGMSVSR